MDIEKDTKAAFKELTNNCPTYFLKAKDVEMTPSSMGQSKKEDKISFFESSKHGMRQFLYS